MNMMSTKAARRSYENFGGNQKWTAKSYQPNTEAEILDILDRHSKGQVRPIGSLHSWSSVAASSGATVDMSSFDSVETFQRDGETLARVGAGATLQETLDTLHEKTDVTLPTLGAIKKQTVSGAVSTATHGSGKPSLSHFVEGMKVAAYDPETGKPKIFKYTDGEKLRAARCGLGTQGVILSLDLRTTPKYLVEETTVQHPDLTSVLSTYDENPLTQFILVPYRWDYMAFERNPVPQRERTWGEKAFAKVSKAFNTVGVDVLWHALMKGSLMVGDKAVKNLLKLTPHLMMKDRTRIDEAEEVLTLKHDLFQHEEMELFLPEDKLEQSVDVLTYATQVFAGEDVEAPPEVEKALKSAGMFEELQENKGSYTQHYPFFFRKIQPEDAMISMASGDKSYFSCSVFTYNAPDDRENYGKYCSFLARCLHKMSDARPHWGKHFPLEKEQIEKVYPELPRFRELARETDPNGVFRNQYTERVLGLKAGDSSTP